jgi:hypothetical protein
VIGCHHFNEKFLFRGASSDLHLVFLAYFSYCKKMGAGKA